MRIASWLETLYIRECLYTTKTVQEEKFLLVVWSESLVNIKDVGTVDIPDEEKEKKKWGFAFKCLFIFSAGNYRYFNLTGILGSGRDRVSFLISSF